MLARTSMGKLWKPIFLIFVIMGACRDNETPLIKPNSYPSQANDIRDHLASIVARNLAMNLADERVRSFVKRKSTEKFDGDYNFLIQVEKQAEVITAGYDRPVNFSDVISGPINGKKLTPKGFALLDSIQHFFPLMQVALRQAGNPTPDAWDVQTEIPLVAYIPNRITDGIIPAFDVQGNYHPLKADVPPPSLTIVISENERMVSIKKSRDSGGMSFKLGDCALNDTPYFEDPENIYYYVDTYYDALNECTGGGGSSSGEGSTENPGCDRDSKTGKDRLNKMIFNSHSAFKQVNDWFDGGQELEVTVFFAQSNGAISKVTKVFYGKDSDFRDCGIFNCTPEWFSLGNTEIVTWDKGLYGNSMLYFWTERDPGNPLEITTSFTVTHEISDETKAVLDVEVSKTITNNDDILGESIVEYCDNTDGQGYSYMTGAITFYVRQQ